MGDVYSFATGEKILGVQVELKDPEAATYYNKIEDVVIAEIITNTQTSSAEADVDTARMLAHIFARARSTAPSDSLTD